MGGLNGAFGGTLMSLFSTGVLTLFGVGLVVVGLSNVRRVSSTAGLCLAGAGGLLAFGAVVRQVVNFALSFGGMGLGTLFTLSQVFTTGMQLLGIVLVPVSIFLLANAVKQGSGPGQGPRLHY